MAQILIIEDDQRLRLALKESLQLHGYEVTDAANGLEGKPGGSYCDGYYNARKGGD
jgi:DNA-binding response OmpR family regulator